MLEKKWRKFIAQRDSERAKFYNSCSSDGRPVHHVLLPHQYDREKLEKLFRLADKIRKIADTRTGAGFLQSLLPHIRVLLMFAQPSTRTMLSFEAACMILGMRFSCIKDLSTTSFVKKESLDDGVQTFSQYFQCIVCRHPDKDFVEEMAWYLNQADRPRPVINAGSQKDVHVTQALLDAYTIWHYKRKQIDGLRLTFCGNLKNSRVARSNVYLLAKNYQIAQINFVADKNLQMESDVLAFLDEMNIPYEMFEDLNVVLSKTDILYMLRDQVEYDAKTGDYTGDFANCGEQDIPACRSLTSENIHLLPPNGYVLHPLPKNNELEPYLEKTDKRIVIWPQTRNGMWIRTAGFAIMFNVDKQIMAY